MAAKALSGRLFEGEKRAADGLAIALVGRLGTHGRAQFV
jgi:hypothetical protein